MANIQAAEGDWLALENVDPTAASFPLEAEVEGTPILILKTKDGYRGCEPLCPHQKVPLKSGTLMGGDTMLRCSRHNFIFRLTDGAGVNCVGMRLKVYAVRERDGLLEVARPA
jgi:nitrite reductase/ring-hydroxylating ferredoxin subunit